MRSDLNEIACVEDEREKSIIRFIRVPCMYPSLSHPNPVPCPFCGTLGHPVNAGSHQKIAVDTPGLLGDNCSKLFNLSLSSNVFRFTLSIGYHTTLGLIATKDEPWFQALDKSISFLLPGLLSQDRGYELQNSLASKTVWLVNSV